MIHCQQCGNVFSPLDWILGNIRLERCRRCEKKVRNGLSEIRHLFLGLTTEGMLSESIWQQLWEVAEHRGLDVGEVQSFLLPDVIHLFEQRLVSCEQKGSFTSEDEQYLQFLQTAFSLADDDLASLLPRYRRMQRLTAIRRGDFDPIEIGETLDADEEAYYKVSVVYLSTEKRKTKPNEPEPGEWLITNKFLYFKRPGARGNPIKWRNILDAPFNGPDCIRLDVSQGSGAGYYTIVDNDPEMVKAYLDTLLKQAKHHMPPRITHKWMNSQQHLKSPNSKYDSVAEQVFLSCWQPTDPPLVHQYRIRTSETTYIVDFAHLPTKTVIELDGFDGHSSPQQIRHDRKRQRAIEALGWRFIRFSGLEVKENPMQVVREARAFILKGMGK
jgi:very-short-patch-repair endonuclease